MALRRGQIGGCFLFFPGLVFNHLTPHLTWAAPAHERQGSGPHRPLPLSLHSVYPMSPKFSKSQRPVSRAVSPASSTPPRLNLRLLRGTGLPSPPAPPRSTHFSNSFCLQPPEKLGLDRGQTQTTPRSRSSHRRGGDPHPGQLQGLRLPLQGRCECAQASSQLAWPAAAGMPRAQLDTRLASLSCTLRGSVPPRASSAPPRETPEFVGTWLCVGGRSLQDYPARCHFAPLADLSLEGAEPQRVARRPPHPHLPVQLAPNWGRGRRPGIASLQTPREPPASVSLPGAHRAL